MLVAIIVGIIAGFLAGKVMNDSGYGIVMDLVIGLLGGIFGRFVLGLVGIAAYGIIGSILVATFGAVVLIWLVRWIRSNRGTA
jgi:Transglycosylase associated protein.